MCRGFCHICYNRGLRNGSVLKIIKPELPNSFSNLQIESLNGSMLGDGCLRKEKGDSSLVIKRALKDVKYLEYEFNIFKDFCSSDIRHRTVFDKRFNKNYHNVAFNTRNSPLFTEFYNLWYPSGKKIIPNNLKLTPITLMHWFCDDGCVTSICKPYRLNLQLSTNGFKKENVEFVVSLLENRYKEQFRINMDKNNPVIQAGDNATRAFLNEIDSFMPESMKRKSDKWRSPEHGFYTNIPSRTYYMNDIINIAKDTELKILSFIKNNINVTKKYLMSELDIKSTTVSSYLKKLQNLNYISIEKRHSCNGGHIYNISDLGIEKLTTL